MVPGSAKDPQILYSKLLKSMNADNPVNYEGKVVEGMNIFNVI
jgi:hypothetical protein